MTLKRLLSTTLIVFATLLPAVQALAQDTSIADKPVNAIVLTGSDDTRAAETVTLNMGFFGAKYTDQLKPGGGS